MIIDPSKVHLTEADIEEYLWQHPEACYVEKWLNRQLAVPSGVIDLLGVTSYDWPAVVEVKNVPVDAKAVAQVSRYAFDVAGIVHSAERFKNLRSYATKERVTKVIVGPSISDQALRECEACDVNYVQFHIELNLSTSLPTWTQEVYDRRWKDYAQIAQLHAMHEEDWYALDRRTIHSQNPDSDEYSDVILTGADPSE